jgi:hypothetical protein
VDTGYSGILGKAAGSSYALLQERTEVQHGWMTKEVGNRTQTKGRNGARKGYRGYRMNVKLADVYLTKNLSEVGKKAKGGKGGKPGLKAKTVKKTK